LGHGPDDHRRLLFEGDVIDERLVDLDAVDGELVEIDEA
jgi:hypothetical protein